MIRVILLLAIGLALFVMAALQALEIPPGDADPGWVSSLYDPPADD